MSKRILGAAALVFAANAPAFAVSQIWNITEVTESVGGPEGQWHVTIDAENRISGSANMQTASGAVVTYTLGGSINGPEVTVEMSERTDGKKGCVANGRSTLNDDQKSHRVVAQVNCESGGKFYIRGGY